MRKLPKHRQRTQQQQQHASAGQHETAAAPEAAAAPTTAAALAALEARIWQPVISDWHRLGEQSPGRVLQHAAERRPLAHRSSASVLSVRCVTPATDAMQRELVFVQNVLAPHFTAAAGATSSCSSSSPTNSSSSAPAACQLAVAAAAQVETPPGLLRALQQHGHSLAPGVSGLLMHDVSLLAPGVFVSDAAVSRDRPSNPTPHTRTLSQVSCPPVGRRWGPACVWRSNPSRAPPCTPSTQQQRCQPAR